MDRTDCKYSEQEQKVMSTTYIGEIIVKVLLVILFILFGYDLYTMRRDK